MIGQLIAVALAFAGGLAVMWWTDRWINEDSRWRLRMAQAVRLAADEMLAAAEESACRTAALTEPTAEHQTVRPRMHLRLVAAVRDRFDRAPESRDWTDDELAQAMQTSAVGGRRQPWLRPAAPTPAELAHRLASIHARRYRAASTLVRAA